MKKKLFIIKTLLAFIILLNISNVKAQVGKLHAIIVVKTSDNQREKPNPLPAWKKSLNAIEDELDNISYYTRLKITKHYFTGSNFNRDEVIQSVKSLNVKSNDVILFFFAGHGYGTDDCIYPNLLISRKRDDNDNKLYIDREEVSISGCELNNLLKGKSPRLLISLYETCNFIVDDPLGSSLHLPDSDLIAKNYKVLFEETKGEVIITASKKGQFAGWNTDIGGYFTYFFLRELHSKLRKDNVKPCDWYDIGVYTIGKLKSYSKKQKDFTTPQILYGEVNLLDRHNNEINCRK